MGMRDHVRDIGNAWLKAAAVAPTIALTGGAQDVLKAGLLGACWPGTGLGVCGGQKKKVTESLL